MSKPRFKFRQKAAGVAPTFPPVVTTNTTQTVPEGTEKRIALTADQGGVGWSITGGADAAKYSIDGSDLVLPSKDFEAPDDVGANNTYVVTVRATNSNGFGEATITTTVQDVAEGGAGNSIRSTQDVYAYDYVAPAIASAPSDAWITVAVTGVVTFGAWLKAENSLGWLLVSNGQSFAFRKNELLDMPMARTVGAADGATGTWDFTWSGGSGSVNFSVLNYPTTFTYEIGQRTPAGFGGPDLEDELPGNASDWSIQTQSTPSAFLKWENNHLTWNGTYNTTKSIGNLTIDSVHTVTMRHGPGTYADRVYSFVVKENLINIAPFPGRDSGASTQFTSALQFRYHGDVILAEPGVYHSGSEFRFSHFNTNYQRSVNPNTPSITKLTITDGPYGGSGDRVYTGLNHNPGWVTVKSKYPHKADLGPYEFDLRTIKLDNVNTNEYFGNHFYGFDNARFRINNLQGTAVFSWFMVSHCKAPGMSIVNTPRDWYKYIFLNHNWVHDAGTGIYLLARYSQVVGNLMERIQVDVFNLYMYDDEMTTWDQRWSRWCWNTNVRKDFVHPYPRTGSNFPHRDAQQTPELDATRAPVLTAKAAGFIVPFQLQFGNIILRTNGVKQPDSSGILTDFDEPDMQGFNGGTMKNSGRLHDLRDLGNAYHCMEQMGIAPSSVDKTTSFVRHNLTTQAMYQQNWNPADVGYSGYTTPQQYIATHVAGDGAPLLDHNAVQSAGTGGYSIVPATPVPNTPTQTGVVHGATSADFVDNTHSDTWQNVEKWCGGPVVKANLAPTPTSRLRPGQANYPVSGTRVIGPFDNLSIIDHRLRTVNATYMVQ